VDALSTTMTSMLKSAFALAILSMHAVLDRQVFQFTIIIDKCGINSWVSLTCRCLQQGSVCRWLGEPVNYDNVDEYPDNKLYNQSRQ
jgi:hypothetical protein